MLIFSIYCWGRFTGRRVENTEEMEITELTENLDVKIFCLFCPFRLFCILSPVHRKQLRRHCAASVREYLGRSVVDRVPIAKQNVQRPFRLRLRSATTRRMAEYSIHSGNSSLIGRNPSIPRRSAAASISARS